MDAKTEIKWDYREDIRVYFNEHQMTAILPYTCYVSAAAASVVPYLYTRIYQYTFVSHFATSSQLIGV